MATSRRTFLQLTAAGALAATPLPAMAATDLTFIVPLGSGGALDKLARRVAKYLPDVSGYSVNVENRLIKGDSDGYQDFLKRPADGSTVLVWFEPAAATYEGNFHLDDLAVINVQEIEPPILAARSDLGWTTLAEVAAEAGKRPNEIRIGAGKAGGHLMATRRQFAELGIKIREVDYASGGKARKGLLAGEVELTVGSLKAIRDLGELVTPLAIMAPRRLRLWPEIPTIVEAVRFAKAKPVFGSAYRFFAVRREVKETKPEVFAKLTEAFRRLTLDHEPFREASDGDMQWFGPADSSSLVARAHAHFLDLKQDMILPAGHRGK
ncbi:MAG: tripartite tricarboxylate transporter substrate-binding protein [Alphaproteobacteria bacterium]